MWTTYLAIAAGGTLGCWARHGLTVAMHHAFGRNFPHATLTINVLGSFLMGFLFIHTLERLALPPALRVGLLTGGLGGFTTFSTFSMEVMLLAEHGQLGKAAAYVGLSVGLGLAAAFGGAWVARSL